MRRDEQRLARRAPSVLVAAEAATQRRLRDDAPGVDAVHGDGRGILEVEPQTSSPGEVLAGSTHGVNERVRRVSTFDLEGRKSLQFREGVPRVAFLQSSSDRIYADKLSPLQFVRAHEASVRQQTLGLRREGAPRRHQSRSRLLL